MQSRNKSGWVRIWDRRRVAAMTVVLTTLGLWLVAGNRVSALTGIGPFNERLAIQVDAGGQFNFGALPNAATGDAVAGTSFSLSYSWPGLPGTSFTTVRVGTSDTVLTSPTTPSANVTGQLAATTGYTVGDIGVTQRVSIVSNPFSGQNDLGRIEYTVTNNGAAAADVGLRYLNDVMVANNDAAPFRVPGVGEVTTETAFDAGSVPQYFNVFGDLANADKVALAVPGGSIAPDRLVIGRWAGMQATDWDYTPTVGAPNGDSAYLVYFNPTSLAPGASRTYVTSYGLGNVSVTTGSVLSVGATSPTAIELTECAYVPNPFSVVATVANNGTGPATGVTASITLPAGLSLASGTATQPLDDLAPGASAEATWSIQIANQPTAVSLEIGVSASATGVPSVSTTRSVAVPAACQEGNTPPTAQDQSLSTMVDTALPVTLTATDPDAGDTLSFATVAGPGNGTLSGTAPALTYTPNAGFTGTDSFTFKANDGTADSNVATITIQVNEQEVTECLARRSLKFSTGSWRSHPRQLDGATVGRARDRGSIAVFLAPQWRRVRGADALTFSLDGEQVSVERHVPYDLLGTRWNGAARMLDVRGLDDGEHTVSVTVSWRDDRPPCTIEASFTVENRRPGHHDHHHWGDWCWGWWGWR